VQYQYPSSEDFLRLFSDGHNNVKTYDYRGGGIGDIRTFESPLYYQRGSGIFSVIASIARRTIPFLRNLFLPTVSDFANTVAQDYSKGTDFKTALKNRGMESIGKLMNRRQGGGKRIVKQKRLAIKKNPKKKKKNDLLPKRNACYTIPAHPRLT
jgi:hypothetical protein